MKPKAVLAYCREKGVKAVDIRFPDGMGRWRHFSIPASGLSEGVFDTGLGLEACWGLAGSDDQTPWILVPVSEAKYLDTTQTEPTLVLLASIQDAWTGQEAWFDPRAVAVRAVEAFRGAGLVDEVLVSTSVPFQLIDGSANDAGCQATQDTKVPMARHKDSRLAFAGGHLDPDATFRANLTHKAVEAGLSVERHYRAAKSTSEILLGSKPLVLACDDQLLLRSLIESASMEHGLAVDQSDLRSKSCWSFLKGSELILGGTRGFGLSDLGWYAAGGVLKHADALAAIAASCDFLNPDPVSHCKRFLSDRTQDSLVGVEPVSNDPRYRALAYRNQPVSCCPYLIGSAIAMAMLDGILCKIAPATEQFSKGTPVAEDGPTRSFLAEKLVEDSGFLLHAEVFSEPLIQATYLKLKQ